MAAPEFIAAIELGSSKVSAIAGHKEDDGSLVVQAYATAESSSFIHKGIIFNIDKAAEALKYLVSTMENQLDGKVISKVYVGTGGQSLHTEKNAVDRFFGVECKITDEIVDEIAEENRGAQYPDSTILDVVPQEFKIDNVLQADPVGASGKVIVGQFLNIVARKQLEDMIRQSFKQASIDIADIVVTPLALANVVLSENERNSGCALVDFGADTTTVSVYKKNRLRYLSVLPLGGSSITKDITSLPTEETDAERLKLKHGDANYQAPKEADDKSQKCKCSDGTIVELSSLNNLVGARVEEILRNVMEQMKRSGYEDQLLSGVVFTGGGSLLRNLESAFIKYSNRNKIKTVHNALMPIRGRISEFKHDGACAALGLLAYGDENCAMPEATSSPEVELDSNEPEIQASDEANAPTADGISFTIDSPDKEQTDEQKRLEEEQKRQEELKRLEEERIAAETAKREEIAAKEAEKTRIKAEKDKKKKERSKKLRNLFENFAGNIFSDDDVKD